MRQVPPKTFLIIGNGRCARHFNFYLSSLGHRIHPWHYKSHSEEQLKTYFEVSDRVILAIKDSALEPFLDRYPFVRVESTFHLSGATEIVGIGNIHPLISFSETLFPLEFYKQIPFAYFHSNQGLLEYYIPGIPNPSFFVPMEMKAFYHGLCVASGNFMVLLWQLVSQEFWQQLALPSSFLIPYMESIIQNLKINENSALTGPIARRDEETLFKNYQALRGTPLKGIFEAHIQLAWPEFALKYF